METPSQTELQRTYDQFAQPGRNALNVAKESDDFNSNPPLLTLQVIPDGLMSSVRLRSDVLSVDDVKAAIFGTVEIGLRESFSVLNSEFKGGRLHADAPIIEGMITALDNIVKLFDQLEETPHLVETAIRNVRTENKEWEKQETNDIKWAAIVFSQARSRLMAKYKALED